MATEDYDIGIGRLSINYSNWIARLFGISLVFVAWIVVASLFPADIMPYPLDTFQTVIELFQSGVVYPNLSATIWRTLWGFLGAMLIGISFGVLMGINDFSRRFFTPHVIAALSVPAVAYAAVTVLIVGFNDLAPISAAILTVFPYIAVNIWKGVEDIDGELIEMSRSFGVPYHRLLFRMIIPDTAGALFSASRFGLAISWRIVTVAEIFSASKGIGIKIVQSYQFFNFSKSWAWAIIFMLIIIVIEYAVFKPLERRVFEYKPDVDISVIG